MSMAFIKDYRGVFAIFGSLISGNEIAFHIPCGHAEITEHCSSGSGIMHTVSAVAAVKEILDKVCISVMGDCIFIIFNVVFKVIKHSFYNFCESEGVRIIF